MRITDSLFEVIESFVIRFKIMADIISAGSVMSGSPYSKRLRRFRIMSNHIGDFVYSVFGNNTVSVIHPQETIRMVLFYFFYLCPMDLFTIPMDEAVREVENKLLEVNTNITNWQRRQNANNNFSHTDHLIEI